MIKAWEYLAGTSHNAEGGDDASRLKLLNMEKLLAKREANRRTSRERMAKLRAKSKAGYAQPTMHRDAASGNGGGLSSRRIQELATWCSDRAYWHFSPNALAAGALDAELRTILGKEVSPERVEIEFERVMKVV